MLSVTPAIGAKMIFGSILMCATWYAVGSRAISVKVI
jgi:hypothetical protein